MFTAVAVTIADVLYLLNYQPNAMSCGENIKLKINMVATSAAFLSSYSKIN